MIQESLVDGGQIYRISVIDTHMKSIDDAHVASGMFAKPVGSLQLEMDKLNSRPI